MEDKNYLYLENGITLKNRYCIDNILGERSNFSIIYEGNDLKTGRQIIIKEFFPKNIALRDMDKKTMLCRNSGFSYKLLSEINNFWLEGIVMKNMECKGTAKCLDIFEENGTAYIIMKYHKGDDLEKVIEDGLINELDVFLEKIIIPLTETLGKIHKSGYLHRDIKPSNIIMENNRPVLIDFGSAVKYKDKNDKKILVTPGFSPVEFYSDKSCQKESSDIYSIAAMIYYFVSGETPPEATKRIIEDGIKPLEKFEIPFLLERLVMKNLSLNLNNRNSSIRNFSYSLKAIVFLEKTRNIFRKKVTTQSIRQQ